MRTLRLYAPAIVLLLLACVTALGLSISTVETAVILAGAVFVHVRAEQDVRR